VYLTRDNLFIFVIETKEKQELSLTVSIFYVSKFLPALGLCKQPHEKQFQSCNQATSLAEKYPGFCLRHDWKKTSTTL
jgi:hypothetical protein